MMEVLKSRGYPINYYGVACLYSVLIAPEVNKTSDKNY